MSSEFASAPPSLNGALQDKKKMEAAQFLSRPSGMLDPAWSAADHMLGYSLAVSKVQLRASRLSLLLETIIQSAVSR